MFVHASADASSTADNVKIAALKTKKKKSIVFILLNNQHTY